METKDGDDDDGDDERKMTMTCVILAANSTNRQFGFVSFELDFYGSVCIVCRILFTLSFSGGKKSI